MNIDNGMIGLDYIGDFVWICPECKSFLNILEKNRANIVLCKCGVPISLNIYKIKTEEIYNVLKLQLIKKIELVDELYFLNKLIFSENFLDKIKEILNVYQKTYIFNILEEENPDMLNYLGWKNSFQEIIDQCINTKDLFEYMNKTSNLSDFTIFIEKLFLKDEFDEILFEKIKVCMEDID